MKSYDAVFEFSVNTEGNGTEDHLLCTAKAEELRAFIPAVMDLPYGSRVLEIGTYTGRSASVYFQLQKALNLEIHLIDIWLWNPRHAAHHFTEMVIEHFNDIPFTFHKMPSALLGSQWTLPLDFLYIDGQHEPPEVDEDFKVWLPFIKSGGTLALHDSDCPGVASCINRFVIPAGYQLLTQGQRMTIWRKP